MSYDQKNHHIQGRGNTENKLLHYSILNDDFESSRSHITLKHDFGGKNYSLFSDKYNL